MQTQSVTPAVPNKANTPGGVAAGLFDGGIASSFAALLFGQGSTVTPTQTAAETAASPAQQFLQNLAPATDTGVTLLPSLQSPAPAAAPVVTSLQALLDQLQNPATPTAVSGNTAEIAVDPILLDSVGISTLKGGSSLDILTTTDVIAPATQATSADITTPQAPVRNTMQLAQDIADTLAKLQTLLPQQTQANTPAINVTDIARNIERLSPEQQATVAEHIKTLQASLKDLDPTTLTPEEQQASLALAAKIQKFLTQDNSQDNNTDTAATDATLALQQAPVQAVAATPPAVTAAQTFTTAFTEEEQDTYQRLSKDNSITPRATEAPEADTSGRLASDRLDANHKAQQAVPAEKPTAPVKAEPVRETAIPQKPAPDTNDSAQGVTTASSTSPVSNSQRPEIAAYHGHTAPAHPVAEQIALHMRKAVNDDVSRIKITMQPASLGSVEISLEVGKDGQVKAVLAADKHETYEWLMRDARHLERILQDSGLKTDSASLSFQFKGDEQRGQGFHQGSQQQGFNGFMQQGHQQPPTPAAGDQHLHATINLYSDTPTVGQMASRGLDLSV